MNLPKEQLVKTDSGLLSRFQVHYCDEWMKENNLKKPLVVVSGFMIQHAITLKELLKEKFGYNVKYFLSVPNKARLPALNEYDSVLHFGRHLIENNQPLAVLNIFCVHSQPEKMWFNAILTFTNVFQSCYDEVLLIYDEKFRHQCKQLINFLEEMGWPNLYEARLDEVEIKMEARRVEFLRFGKVSVKNLQKIFYFGDNSHSFLEVFSLPNETTSVIFNIFNPSQHLNEDVAEHIVIDFNKSPNIQDNNPTDGVKKEDQASAQRDTSNCCCCCEDLEIVLNNCMTNDNRLYVDY